MKKIISLLVSATVLLGITAIAADGSYSDIAVDNVCYTHIERLTDFGFISGYDDGTFKPNNYVSRAETAKLACVARNLQVIGLETETLPYSDITSEHWAYNYIVCITYEGMVSGYDDDTFRPNDTITYNEYLKIFVNLLGYDSYAQDKGGYPIGYIETADEMKLTDGIEFEGDDIVTRDDAAIIMNRALDVPLYKITSYGKNENGEYVPKFDVMNGTGRGYQTLLTARHNIYTVSGIVGENEDLPVEDRKPIDTPQTWEVYSGGEIGELEFKDAMVLEYPTLYSLPTKYMTADGIVNIVPLGKDNSKITVIFDEDNIDGLYVTLYDVTDDKYVLSRDCVKLTSKEYTMTNLIGGHEYKVKVSSTEERKVDGKIVIQ